MFSLTRVSTCTRKTYKNASQLQWLAMIMIKIVNYKLQFKQFYCIHFEQENKIMILTLCKHTYSFPKWQHISEQKIWLWPRYPHFGKHFHLSSSLTERRQNILQSQIYSEILALLQLIYFLLSIYETIYELMWYPPIDVIETKRWSFVSIVLSGPINSLMTTRKRLWKDYDSAIRV